MQAWLKLQDESWPKAGGIQIRIHLNQVAARAPAYESIHLGRPEGELRYGLACKHDIIPRDWHPLDISMLRCFWEVVASCAIWWRAFCDMDGISLRIK